MRFFVTVFLVVIIISFSNAQESDSASPSILTFEHAVIMGLEMNVDLNQNKNQLAYTRVNKTSSFLQMGPNVQANVDAYRSDGNRFIPNTGEVVNGLLDNVQASVTASMPIFNGFNKQNSYKAANSSNEAQLHLIQRTQQDVIRQVANQYLTCLLDQQLIGIAEENLAAQVVQRDRIKTQVDLGSVAEADLYTQEFQLKNAELTLVRAKIKLRTDKVTLAQTIQADPAIQFELEPLEMDINIAVADTLSLDNMYRTALSKRSDLSQAMEVEKATGYRYSATKGLYYPSLYAGVNFGTSYNYNYNPAPGEINRPFVDQFRNDNRYLNYGFSLVVPIYGGLSRRAQAAQSRVNFENAKLQHESTKLKIKSDVITAYQNFRDAITNYEASAAQLKAAEISFQLEDERYNLGVSDIVQRNTANQALVQAKGDFQSALYTLMFQRIMIDYAVGTLNSDVIEEY